MELVKVRSNSLYEEKFSYSRVVAIGDWILVSNTAGRDFKTRIMPASGLDQAKQAFRNIEGALASVGATLADVVRSRICIPYLEDKDAILAYVAERYRGIDPVNTTTASPLASPEYRVEIEVTAYRGAGRMAQKRTTVEL
jgi:enamine deaminase RidA (YjgF/YER057c/UK114 family)